MSLTVDYSTASPWLITIPKSDLTLTTGTQYQLTVDEFWILLRDFTDNENPMAQPKLYSRIPATSSTPSITTVEEDYYELEFEDGLYSVNIVNGNTNIREAEVKNQVSVNTNNTTGFIDPIFLQSTTFIGKQGVGVSVSPATGTNSTEYPVGTRETPCKTETNMHTIVESRGLHNVYIMDTINLYEDHSDGHVFFGDNPQTVNINIGDVATYPSKSVANCKFQDAYVTGELDSANIIWESIVGSITNANGFIYQSTLIGPIVFSDDTSLERCWAAPTQADTDVILDFNGQQINVAVSSWNGGRILVKNMVTGSTFIANGSGHIEFDSTNTGGDWRIYPGFHYHDNSGATWSDTHDHTTAHEVWNEPTANHLADGTYGHELATKADIAASTSTSQTTTAGGTIVYGTDDTGADTDTYARDTSYWEIGEDGTNGITVQFDFNLPDDDRPGIISIFGRYTGTPSTTHYQELWAYNFETASYEQLIEEFMPGGKTSDVEYQHEFFERNIDRTSNNLVRIQIRHNVTAYNASHALFVDYISASSIEVVTAVDIAQAVMDYAIEGSYTFEEINKIISAALGGKLSGAGTTNVKIRDINDAKDRIDATVDDDGNRTAVILDVS